MPEQEVKRFGWRRLLALLVLLALLSILGLYYRQELSAVFDRFGNAASVLGLAVSLIGFALTILTLLETQRIEKDARRRIEEAVRTAQKETREAVAKIGLQLLAAESDSLRRLVSQIQEAHRGSLWTRAAEKCEEAQHLSILLAGNPHLNEEEKRGLRGGAEDLRIIANFIFKNRIPAGSVNNPLATKQTDPLDKLVALTTGIQARLRATSLEVPHATNQQQQQTS
jgi:hypothetical protein